jgi:hypothetical protein
MKITKARARKPIAEDDSPLLNISRRGNSSEFNISLEFRDYDKDNQLRFIRVEMTASELRSLHERSENTIAKMGDQERRGR